MADKGKFLFIRLLVLCLGLCLSPAFAQDVEVALGWENYLGHRFFIYRDEEETRFIQRLIWEEAEYVLHYTAILEQQGTDGVFREIQRRSVTESYIDFSLYSGRYRLRVDVYDLLDELAFSTDWQYFYVQRALQPRLTGFSPSTFFLDKGRFWEITVHGENLRHDSEFALVAPNARITPRMHNIEAGSARLVFAYESLMTGVFYIYVRNPGGLDALLGTFNIVLASPFDINISLGYAPVLPMRGFLFNDFEYMGSILEAPFPDAFYALGAIARISLIPFKRPWGNLGIEVSSSLAFLDYEAEGHSINAMFLNAHVSLLYQRFFSGRRNFAFNLILGGGLTALIGFQYTFVDGRPPETTASQYASAIAGISFKGFFLRPFYIVAGVDFIHVFTPEEPMPNFIRPSVGIGIRF